MRTAARRRDPPAGPRDPPAALLFFTAPCPGLFLPGPASFTETPACLGRVRELRAGREGRKASWWRREGSSPGVWGVGV